MNSGTKLIHIENVHVDLVNKGYFLGWGWKLTNQEGLPDLKASLNGSQVEMTFLDPSDSLFTKIFMDNSERNFIFRIKIPEKLKDNNLLKIFLENDGELSELAYYYYTLKDIRSGIQFKIDTIHLEDDTVYMRCWAVGAKPVSLHITEKGKERVNDAVEVKTEYRKDVLLAYPEVSSDGNIGFAIHFSADNISYPILLQFTDDSETVSRKITRLTVKKASMLESGEASRLIARSYEVIRRDGIKGLCSKVYKYVFKKDLSIYNNWAKLHDLSKKELKHEKDKEFENRPVISIIVPVYHTPKNFLKELISSVKNQTYVSWKLYLGDAGTDSSGVSMNTEFIKREAAKDDRIKYLVISENAGIAENTNYILERADGDFFAFMDHDDLLTSDALFEVVSLINNNPDAEFIYSDEDKIDEKGKFRFDPFFKPDFNPDLLNSMNYISHLSVVRKTLLDRVGLLNPEYNGSQDYDFTFRCTENTKNIYHIPKVLYHWRANEDSTAMNQDSKLYAFESGKKAVQAHMERTGYKDAVVEELEDHGKYRIHYKLRENPLVSIIIPNKDHSEDLKRCIDSILQKTTYKNYEIIVVENNSELSETWDYYKEIEKEDNIKVVKYIGGFNYSAINNFGVSFSRGDYVLLLNNDIEIISEGWLSEMLALCMRDNTGIVGAKLIYPDGTLQHAGVILGIGAPRERAVAGHAFKYFSRNSNAQFSRIMVVQDYSAVTAACLMVKKSVFEEVDGLSEDLAVAFNDVDFCMKVRKAGYLIVYCPFAELYHYESKSRGEEDTPEKQARFTDEINVFRSRWGTYIDNGDPYYNPNLTLLKEDFSLKLE